MALHPKPDFAKLCGISTREISIYAKRKKIVLSGDYIDDSLEVNRLFIEKRKIKLSETGGSTRGDNSTPPHQKRNPHYSSPEVDEQDVPDVGDIDDDDNEAGWDSKTMQGLTKQKLVVEIEKKKREIALLKIRQEKLNAVVIPTDLVKIIFAQHSRSIATEFKNSVDTILTLISKKADLRIEQTAELRGSLLQQINEAMERSVTESKKNINNIVKEFIEKKEVGERG